MKLKIIRAILDTPPEVDRQILALLSKNPERIDGRLHPRHQVNYPARINGYDAKAVDLSAGGCRLRARTYLEIGQAVHVELYTVPDLIKFQGEVRHADNDAIGIKVSSISDEQIQLFKRAISRSR